MQFEHQQNQLRQTKIKIKKSEEDELVEEFQNDDLEMQLRQSTLESSPDNSS